MTARDYGCFLAAKLQHGAEHGFAPKAMPESLFDFQVALVEWAQRKGRAAIFADCGLGKTAQQLAWADNVVRETNRPVLVLTPLAVAQQTIREGEKFGIEVRRAPVKRAGIYVSNYEKLHRFDPAAFAGVVCDESSAIKAFDGKRRAEVTEFMRTVPYRLLCTATAAPNDYIELGTSSEALGELGQMDMLNRFFKNDTNNSATGRKHGQSAKWRFKGHAEEGFWRWVCSWARAIRKPSDLGFSDERFRLPPLIEQEHVVEARTLAPGMLFALPAQNMYEEREERRRTIRERCERVAGLVETGRQVMVWCHLNAEGDLLEEMIPDAQQVAGKHSDDEKEARLMAFADGDLRVLVIKDRIGAWGLNLQNCNHVVRFATHSYEAHYQAVRRCWRFGQKNPVTVDLVVTEGERGIAENLQRKSEAADRMFESLVAHMNSAMRIDRGVRYETSVEVPAWL